MVNLTDIRVDLEEERGENREFSVEVNEGGTSSHHSVTVEDDDYQQLAPEDVSHQELVAESFRFLLEREPKSSILSSFDLTVIGNYFPEYEDEIRERLQG